MFKGDYLRVLTPKTSDGVSPLVDGEGRIQYREDHLPLSAKKMLDKKNEKLTPVLRKKIEVVSNTVSRPVKTSPKPAPATHELDVDEVDDEAAGYVEHELNTREDVTNLTEQGATGKPKGKGGRPKKNA